MALQITASITPDMLTALAEIHARTLPFQSWDGVSIIGITTQPHHHIRVAMKGGVVGGFIVWRAILDEAELLTIAVTPSIQREKIGSKLLGEMLKDASMRPVKQCFLEVAEDNAAAQQFYKISGFGEFGRRKDYYRRGAEKPIGAVLMRRIFA